MKRARSPFRSSLPVILAALWGGSALAAGDDALRDAFNALHSDRPRLLAETASQQQRLQAERDFSNQLEVLGFAKADDASWGRWRRATNGNPSVVLTVDFADETNAPQFHITARLSISLENAAGEFLEEKAGVNFIPAPGNGSAGVGTLAVNHQSWEGTPIDSSLLIDFLCGLQTGGQVDMLFLIHKNPALSAWVDKAKAAAAESVQARDALVKALQDPQRGFILDPSGIYGPGYTVTINGTTIIIDISDLGLHRVDVHFATAGAVSSPPPYTSAADFMRDTDQLKSLDQIIARLRAAAKP